MSCFMHAWHLRQWSQSVQQQQRCCCNRNMLSCSMQTCPARCCAACTHAVPSIASQRAEAHFVCTSPCLLSLFSMAMASRSASPVGCAVSGAQRHRRPIGLGHTAAESVTVATRTRRSSSRDAATSTTSIGNTSRVEHAWDFSAWAPARVGVRQQWCVCPAARLDDCSGCRKGSDAMHVRSQVCVSRWQCQARALRCSVPCSTYNATAMEAAGDGGCLLAACLGMRACVASTHWGEG